jgi:triacylglycerol esterase/lipase EstA (alpha/beta hydrolase family)
MASLAELSFHHAEQGGGRPYDLAAALYAWAYLFPDDPNTLPNRFDPRVRLASDIYNRGVTSGFESPDGKRVDLQGGTFPLPFGWLYVDFSPDALVWRNYQLVDFVPIAELSVQGFQTQYRWPGIGAPLAAAVRPLPAAADRDLVAPRVRVPVTAVLRPTALHDQLGEGRVQAALDVYPGYGEHTIDVGGRKVPLEAEPTAALGLMATETPIWGREIGGFLHGMGVITKKTRLVALRPYQPGLIPVVFVHGTASSAGRWAQLYNELDNDPRIHGHYQFWFFSYETGNPIAYSAMLLRESLENTVKRLDPEGKDPALRQMVVIGHSQGGLLTKTLVVEPGDRFWRNVSNRPLEDLHLSGETSDLLRRALLFHPLPFVSRVIFVSTPHHGSYVAGSWLAHQAARLIRMPVDITRTVGDLATFNRKDLAIQGIRGAPTAVDNMTPGNPFVKTLAQLPIEPGVRAHSIISVKNPGPPQGQNDGVVEYNSAHIDGVDSEFVVISPHSCQANPHTIEEVRRILLLHLATVEPTGAAVPAAAH